MKTDNTMTAREKFLEVMGYDGPPWIIGLMESHAEAYKSALRKAIEESIKGTESVIEDYERNGEYGDGAWIAAKSQQTTFEYVLQLLDTVLPNNPE